MSWVSPTSHNDPGVEWSTEPNAYDDDTGTSAHRVNIPTTSWSSFLELIIASITCSKVRFWANFVGTAIETIDVDVYKDGAWEHVYEGTFLDDQWVEKTFVQGAVTMMRVRFYNKHAGSPATGSLREADFWDIGGGAPSSHKKCSSLVMGL